MDNFFLLMHFAKKGALLKRVESSTLAVSKELFLSQQSVSRKLRELKSDGFLELSSSPRGVSIFVTPKGKKILLKVFNEMQGVFYKNQAKFLKGVVESGLGEGKYYLSFSQYQEQIIGGLGFKPFLGTLNLKVNEADLAFFRHGQKELVIEGFKTKQRTFGGLKAIKVKINGAVDGALVFPDRSNNPKDVAEVIAPVFLRGKLGLRDGSVVTVKGSGFE